MNVQPLFDTLASLTVSCINVFALEVIVTALLDISPHGIKFRWDALLRRLPPYRKFGLAALIIFGLAFSYDQITNFYYQNIISAIASTGWKTLPAFVFAMAIALFWISKFFLRGSLENKAVWLPLVTAIVAFLIWTQIPNTAPTPGALMPPPLSNTS